MKVSPNINIKVNKLLPKSMAIASAGTHLYSIGLSLYKPFNARNRHTINNPYFIYCIRPGIKYWHNRFRWLLSLFHKQSMVKWQYFI